MIPTRPLPTTHKSLGLSTQTPRSAKLRPPTSETCTCLACRRSRTVRCTETLSVVSRSVVQQVFSQSVWQRQTTPFFVATPSQTPRRRCVGDLCDAEMYTWCCRRMSCTIRGIRSLTLHRLLYSYFRGHGDFSVHFVSRRWPASVVEDLLNLDLVQIRNEGNAADVRGLMSQTGQVIT